MTHSQVYNDDMRPLVALDWSFSAVHTTTEGESVTRWHDMPAFLESLPGPHKIVAESSFGSWDPDRRKALIEQLRAAGHELYVFRPKYTARLRKSLPHLEKSDANDARVIYMIATNGKLHLYPVRDPDAAWLNFRRESNLEWGISRLDGTKATYAKQAKRLLGPYKTQPETRQRALGNGKDYSPTVIAVLYFCALKCSTRNEFERLIGLHGSGYPSLLRSEIHNHSMKHARNRGVSMSAYRREIRRAWRDLRNALVPTQPVEKPARK